MKIKSIEPTPSPNTMKIILDEELKSGERNNYKKADIENAPEEIGRILSIDGVKGVYHVADFLAVERNSKYDWKEILPQVRVALGEDTTSKEQKDNNILDRFGEIQVFVQYFKGIPMQVKLTDGDAEKRYGLPEKFLTAINQVQLPGDNVVFERKWVEQGVRYGDFDEIGQTIVEELNATFSNERLQHLIDYALSPNQPPVTQKYRKITMEDLSHADWKKRYAALEQMAEPTLADLPILEKALSDDNASIRRLAVVYFGMIEDKAVLPYIYQGLKDKSVTVRRTAGDCLSDLGFKEAQEEMIAALKDKNKLVRWRAAMFLYEVGDEKAIPALKEAENDPEFEVALQVKMAIERIASGELAKGSIWKQMLEARKNE
ncbi:conserved virulence factor C family protein [Bacillus kwashiorkori]|uniref:conserved virulence factor C family protein n=1 Tax=Bacillus kwashiorkori TaxID=1522318 RepID=UPI00078601FE|nr:conserved virulence factor C family protein [Bacillus kwashiorkori]